MANTTTRKAAPAKATKAAAPAAVPTMEQMMAMMAQMQAQLAAAQAAPAAKATTAKKAAAFEPEFIDLGTWDDEGNPPPAVKVTVDGREAWAWRTRKGTTALTWNKPPKR